MKWQFNEKGEFSKKSLTDKYYNEISEHGFVFIEYIFDSKMKEIVKTTLIDLKKYTVNESLNNYGDIELLDNKTKKVERVFGTGQIAKLTTADIRKSRIKKLFNI